MDECMNGFVCTYKCCIYTIYMYMYKCWDMYSICVKQKDDTSEEFCANMSTKTKKKIKFKTPNSTLMRNKTLHIQQSAVKMHVLDNMLL